MDLFETYDDNLVEALRRKALDSLFDMASFQAVWPVWQRNINARLTGDWNSTNILALGDCLSEIFKATASGDRGQSSVSAGGAVWEALVCWYMNLCLCGSRTVVVKHKKALLPVPLAKAITVKYGNVKSNTESDLLAITFPDSAEYLEHRMPTSVKLAEISSSLNQLCERDFGYFCLTVIQCKTNWNDNAQVPMLWDMIYRAKGFDSHNIMVGDDNFSIANLSHFSYSFVTVPTSRLAGIKANSTCVNRVRNLTGGNYWGMPTKSGVAESIKEIFSRNFSKGVSPQGLRATLGQAIENPPLIRGMFRL